MRVVVLLAVLLGQIAFSLGANPTVHGKSRTSLKGVNNFIVYYGIGRLNELRRYDLAILQPDAHTAEELTHLRSYGTLLVAYLSIGEVDPARPWYSDGRVDPHWLLGRNKNWGSYYVDASQPGWQQLILSLTEELISKGYHGVFLDNIDTGELFPHVMPGFTGLIHRLRTRFPDAVFIQNRGFTILDTVASDLDALMFEGLSTGYDFEKHQYIYVNNTFLAGQISLIHQQTGLPILALDYAPPNNPQMARLAAQTARNYGFIPAVSVIHLTDIPDYGFLP